MESAAAYRELIDRFKEFRLLESIGAMAGWDQHTYMPPKGRDHRAEQMGYLAKLGHEKLTSPRLGRIARPSRRVAAGQRRGCRPRR